MSVIINSIEQYFDKDGEPLQSGYIYFGQTYGNPVTQPTMVYFDPEFTIPAAQPVRTMNGYPVRSGTPTGIYAPEDVSILVQNKNKEQVFYVESSAIDTGDTTTLYRETDTTLNADDNNRTFILLNPIVQTFSPSVNLGDRWRVNIINFSNGLVTLDPNLAETIDGKSSLILQPNQIATVYCDGINLKSTTSVYPTATIPSASTLDLRAVKPKVITVSGTNTISAVQMIDGDKITAVFSGACQLTHGTNLQIPGAANYTTAAGDILTFTSNGTVTRVQITKADGTAVTAPTVINGTNDPTYVSTSATNPASPQWVNGYLSSRRFVSSDQVMTAGGLLTIPHGLGAVPSLTYVTLKCTTADGTNSVGDLIDINGISEGSAQSAGTEIKKDATNLYVRIGSGGIVLLNTSGSVYNITLSNYRLIATAQL